MFRIILLVSLICVARGNLLDLGVLVDLQIGGGGGGGCQDVDAIDRTLRDVSKHLTMT